MRSKLGIVEMSCLLPLLAKKCAALFRCLCCALDFGDKALTEERSNNNTKKLIALIWKVVSGQKEIKYLVLRTLYM